MVYRQCDETLRLSWVVVLLLLFGTVIHEAAACGEDFSDSTNTFKTPNYPSDYANNLECAWTIIVPVGYSIDISFAATFDIEEFGNCAYDYLEIREVQSNGSTTTKKLCGTAAPADYKSSGRKLQVKFVSDFGSPHKGFQATYQQQDIDECLSNKGGCEHICTNSPGSFTCSCNSGYILNGQFNCEDDDECQTNNGGCTEVCENNPGSFVCKCDTPSRYQLAADATSCEAYCSIVVSDYDQETHCTGMILSRSHRLQTYNVKTTLECLVACSGDDACVSVVIEKASGLLCHLGSSLAASDCSNMEAVNGSVKYYKKKQSKESPAMPETCENGGVYFADNDTCQCEAPYHGTNCSQVYRDCVDIGNMGYTEKRPYLIHPPSSPVPFTVYCVPKHGRTFVFEKKKGDVDFNSSWQDYVHGFGQLSGDHWLGLDHVGHLTLNEGKNYGLMFTFTLFNGTLVYVLYRDFKLGGADTGYKFTMNPNVPNIAPGDCFSPLVGAPFSTYDNDSDNSTSINCAQRHGWGWWYRGDTCFTVCSPLGRLNKNSDLWSGDERDAFWTVDSVRLPLKAVQAYLLVR